MKRSRPVDKVWNMALPAHVEIAAVQSDADGVARIGGTRVTLDSVVYAFQQGATAEEIAQQYPALKLADVYGAITYYLTTCISRRMWTPNLNNGAIR